MVRMPKLVRSFARHEGGNFAMTFAIVGVALFGVAGGAIDYTRVMKSRSEFQQAVDEAAIAAAVENRKNGWNKAKKAGQDAFAAFFDDNVDAKFKKLTLELDAESNMVRATADAASVNHFLMLAGLKKFDFTVTAEVRYPDYPVEVAMVLDSTGSMSADGKMTALKSTAKSFVDTLLSAPGSDVKIGIVPFAQYVNVGRDKLGQSWLSAKDEKVTVPKSCNMQQDLISKSGCSTTSVDYPRQWVEESCSYNDGVPTCAPAHWQDAYTNTQETCTNYQYGPPYEVCVPEQKYTIEWNGCVGSRNYPLNIEDKTYSTRIPGLNNIQCPSQITELTNNPTTLKGAIDQLIPTGMTYIPQGIAWGTRILSSQKPFTEGRTKAEMKKISGKKYLILMTDGANVRSPQIPDSAYHEGEDIAKADNWTTETCDFAKSEDLIVYTVSFGTDVPAATKTRLRNCATLPEYYFDASGNANLAQAFEAIANAIVTVHLSK